MITKSKKSVSLSNSLLDEMALYNPGKCVSEFIEDALIYYIDNIKKQERIKRDLEILNANAGRFNKEALENLEFQNIP